MTVRISEVIWYRENINHIGRHDITPREVEEAIFEGRQLL